MGSLRSNLLISAIALVLVGSIRPAFHAVVNRTFGAETNGHAAGLIALIFLASLPATAGLPTVMVRHVSRAVGAGNSAGAAGHAHLASVLTLLLAVSGIAAVILYGRSNQSLPTSALDLAFVGVGIAGYSYWRLYRSLLLSVGKALTSLKAEIASVLTLTAGLVLVVVFDAPRLVVGVFCSVYAAFALLTWREVSPFLRNGHLDPEERRSFLRYTLLWFVASGASLAVKELSIILLDARTDRAVVGEFSVALALLMTLALAPRVLEIPLLHELAAFAGEDARAKQRALTERALDWLTVLMLSLSGGLAILATPILAIVGGVNTPLIALSFAIVSAAFASELIVTPANDLMISEAHPGVLASIGAASLAAAFLFWMSPWSGGLMGIVLGLSLAHVLRATAIVWYTRSRYGVLFFRRATRKALVLAVGSTAAFFVHRRGLDPWPAFIAFEVSWLALLSSPIREMMAALLGRFRWPKRRAEP